MTRLLKPNLLHVQSNKIYRNEHETDSKEWMENNNKSTIECGCCVRLTHGCNVHERNTMHILHELAVNGQKERVCVRRHQSTQTLESGILHFMNKNYCIQRIRQYTRCCGWKTLFLRLIEFCTSLFYVDFRENWWKSSYTLIFFFNSFHFVCISLWINISL